MGDAGFLKSINEHVRRALLRGSLASCRAEVIGKSVDSSDHLVELKITIEDQGGDVMIPDGHARHELACLDLVVNAKLRFQIRSYNSRLNRRNHQSDVSTQPHLPSLGGSLRHADGAVKSRRSSFDAPHEVDDDRHHGAQPLHELRLAAFRLTRYPRANPNGLLTHSEGGAR